MGHVALDIQTIGQAEQTGGTQAQQFGIGGGEVEAFDPARRGLRLRDGRGWIGMLGQGIERAAGGEERTDRTSAHIRVGKTGAQRIAGAVQRLG